MGVPIVTWPDIYLRDRVTYSFYRTMGIDELTASSAEEYILLANKLANDQKFRTNMSNLIKNCSEKFFENKETVEELGHFLVAAIEASQKGDNQILWNT